MTEFEELNQKLNEVVEVGNWWDIPNKSFGGITPREQFEINPEPLWDMLYQLQTGMPR